MVMRETASNQAATIINQQYVKVKTISVLKKDKNRSRIHKIAGSISIEHQNQSAQL
jgi:hypothetical protein